MASPSGRDGARARKTTNPTTRRDVDLLLFSFAIAVAFGTLVIRPSAADFPSPAGSGIRQAQPQDQPVFRSGAQVIEVDVRVFDTSGRFVPNLEPKDFEVFENGQPQRIQSVYLVSSDGAVAVAGAAATGPALATSTPPPPAPAGTRQTWIFVFDLQHLSPGAGFDRARQAVRDFIRDRFSEGDLAGVVAGTRMLNNRLTTVREELVAAVEGVKPLSGAGRRSIELTREWPRFQDIFEAVLVAQENTEALQRVSIRACSDDPDACKRVQPDLAIREKAHRLVGEEERATVETLNALNALASGLARMPGPKAIVFLSNGFLVERAETTLRGVVGQMARAGGRIYAIDVRGLNRGRGAGIIDQQYANDEAGGPAQLDAEADGPNSLAVDTGGMMIRNENNIGRALGQISADASEYYVVGYQPAEEKFDGKYRSIEVRVKRPGVKVRARRGYLAIEPAKMLVPRPLTASPSPPAAAVTPAAPVAAGTTEPTAPAATAPGTVTSAPSPTPAGTIRLRPDAESRVEALSGGTIASADAAAKKGWEAYQSGKVEEALPLLEEAAARAEVRPWVVYTLGFSQLALGRPVDAAASWERVRKAAPDFEPVYIDLADAYAQVSDLTKALAVLRDAEKRWPSDPELHNAIGVIHVRRGALDEALTAFRNAAEAAPNDPLACFNLARTYELRYSRGQRYVSSQRVWVAPEQDRQKALEYYRQYLKMGGPYATQAAEAISRLEWSKK